MKNEIWRILVIDDNPDDRADLRQMLMRGSDRRYRFTESELGAEGVRKVYDTQDGPYDCVLLDYSLPDMNAEEVLAALRNGAELPACPVVVVTGSGRADGKMLLRAGAQDYIGKDWTTPASITRAVENSIERFALLADRARAREVLRIERERLDLALRYGGMGTYEWNMVDDSLWWSDEVYPVFGVTPETFAPTRDAVMGLVHPDDREIVWRHVLESIAHRQPLVHEFRIVHPDGRVRWIADRGQTEYNGEGRGVRHYGVAFDISERRQVEEALREREHFLQRIADVTPGVIQVFDLEERRSVYINRPVAALLGYGPDEIAAMGREVVPRLMHPDDQPLFEQHLARVRELTDSEFASFEHRMCDRAGEWHWFHNRDAVFARDAGGGVRQIIGSAIEISDRKVAEAKLLEAKLAAEAANRAKSDFLSSMTHELRTPLHAILGFAQLLDAGTPPPTIAQKRSIDQVLKAGWHLLGLINEVLDLALIESGKLSLSMQAVSLAEVLHDCRTMVEPQAEQRGISVSFAPIDAACRVDADPTRLKQVIINLLANAIKYNKLGGTVGVTCSASPPGAVRISVQDTGEGLAPEQVAQLFQPFQRLEHQAMGEEGTGIGLVVCKRLVDLMKGRIGVDSALAKGSVFWIEVNVAAGQAAGDAGQAALVAPAPVQGDAPVHSLLYIEDDPDNLMLIEELLARRNDVRLLSARNANQGIKLARSFLPDVILMDVRLPDKSGVRALKILADDPATARIPVLALSANAIPRDIEKAEKAGFFRYLSKPIQVDEFMGTLDVALGLAKKEVARPAEQERA